MVRGWEGAIGSPSNEGAVISHDLIRPGGARVSESWVSRQVGLSSESGEKALMYIFPDVCLCALSTRGDEESEVMDLDKAIRKVPDFPKPGILFYDITSIFTNPEAFAYVVDRMLSSFDEAEVDGVIAIDFEFVRNIFRKNKKSQSKTS